MTLQSFHPSDIKLREEHCGHAITLRKNGTPYDRNIFQVGVASHAMLEEIGKAINKNPDISTEEIKQLADNLAVELTTKGRSYDKRPEPPMNIKQALEGKQLAIKHLLYNPLPPDAIYEMPIAFDENWNRVKYYDDNVIFRTLLDMVQVIEETDEEGDTTKTIFVRDYKSSWYIDQDMMDNIQRRAQAISAWLCFPDADIIKLNVFSLRTGKQISREINTHEEIDTLKQWHEDIKLALKILQQKQQPSPGANCINCPYAKTCQHTARVATQSANIIERYISSLAVVKALEPDIKRKTKVANYKTNGGYVGYITKTRNSPVKSATQDLWNIWKDNNGDIEGYLSMLSISATVAKKILKALNRQGIETDDILEQIIRESNYSQFGVHKE